jgi:hypothetical protein
MTRGLGCNELARTESKVITILNVDWRQRVAM